MNIHKSKFSFMTRIIFFHLAQNQKINWWGLKFLTRFWTFDKMKSHSIIILCNSASHLTKSNIDPDRYRVNNVHSFPTGKRKLVMIYSDFKFSSSTSCWESDKIFRESLIRHDFPYKGRKLGYWMWNFFTFKWIFQKSFFPSIQSQSILRTL